jgi:hypothetical protein
MQFVESFFPVVGREAARGSGKPVDESWIAARSANRRRMSRCPFTTSAPTAYAQVRRTRICLKEIVWSAGKTYNSELPIVEIERAIASALACVSRPGDQLG